MSRKNLPQHIAIIMDGNGRWAAKRNLPRPQGHLEGVKRVEEIVEAAAEEGIKVLTLFAFSTENWNRPVDEVSILMRTLISVLNQKIRKLSENNVKMSFIGRRQNVPKEVLHCMDSAVELTKDNTGMVLNVAFNYGSRKEIVDAAVALASAVQKGQLKIDEITEETFRQALYTKDLPDPDLLIRTSGEQRISNFLLWQLSYAELYFTDKYWPEFNVEEFRKALADYESRDRRYGKVTASTEGHNVHSPGR